MLLISVNTITLFHQFYYNQSNALLHIICCLHVKANGNIFIREKSFVLLVAYCVFCLHVIILDCRATV